jgi:hypothetical protein
MLTEPLFVVGPPLSVDSLTALLKGFAGRWRDMGDWLSVPDDTSNLINSSNAAIPQCFNSNAAIPQCFNSNAAVSQCFNSNVAIYLSASIAMLQYLSASIAMLQYLSASIAMSNRCCNELLVPLHYGVSL